MSSIGSADKDFALVFFTIAFLVVVAVRLLEEEMTETKRRAIGAVVGVATIAVLFWFSVLRS